jgi:hypothetical protein
MSLRKVSLVTCLLISVFCLVAGYAIARQWIGAMIAILMGPAWWLARKYPNTELPLASLFVSVGLAVAGRLIGSPSLLMIFGSATALAGWDLLSLDAALDGNSSGQQTRQYETKHLQSLALALGFGILATLSGRLLNLQIPFIVLILFIIFSLVALDHVWGYIKKTREP